MYNTFGILCCFQSFPPTSCSTSPTPASWTLCSWTTCPGSWARWRCASGCGPATRCTTALPSLTPRTRLTTCLHSLTTVGNGIEPHYHILYLYNISPYHIIRYHTIPSHTIPYIFITCVAIPYEVQGNKDGNWVNKVYYTSKKK